MEGYNEIVPLKVLMTTDTTSGIWTYTLELTRALEIHYVHVYLVTTGKTLSSLQREQLALIPNITVYEGNLIPEWLDNAQQENKAFEKWLLQLAQTIEPDIIHLNTYAYARLPWAAPVVIAAHACSCSWWEAVKTKPVPAQLNDYRKNIRAGLTAAEAVVAPSKEMLSSLTKCYGSFPNAQVIYHGCHQNDFYVNQKQPFIVSMGNLQDEAKNIAGLCEVAPNLPWNLQIISNDKNLLSVDTYTANVQWYGEISRSQLAKVLSKASIYVAPVYYEPFGFSAMEAALSGCALVLSDIESMREIWQDAAIYVDPRDPKAIEGALTQLISDDLLRTQLATQARHRALSFSVGRMAGKYMRLYTSLLQQKHKSKAA